MEGGFGIFTSMYIRYKLPKVTLFSPRAPCHLTNFKVRFTEDVSRIVLYNSSIQKGITVVDHFTIRITESDL